MRFVFPDVKKPDIRSEAIPNHTEICPGHRQSQQKIHMTPKTDLKHIEI